MLAKYCVPVLCKTSIRGCSLCGNMMSVVFFFLLWVSATLLARILFILVWCSRYGVVRCLLGLPCLCLRFMFLWSRTHPPITRCKVVCSVQCLGLSVMSNLWSCWTLGEYNVCRANVCTPPPPFYGALRFGFVTGCSPSHSPTKELLES